MLLCVVSSVCLGRLSANECLERLRVSNSMTFTKLVVIISHAMSYFTAQCTYWKAWYCHFKVFVYMYVHCVSKK